VRDVATCMNCILCVWGLGLWFRVLGLGLKWCSVLGIAKSLICIVWVPDPQKSPMYVAKETYVFGKRAIYTRKVAGCCWRILVVDLYVYISFQSLICMCIYPLNKIQVVVGMCASNGHYVGL